MNTHTAPFGPGLQALFTSAPLPRRAAPQPVVVPRQTLPLGWLERLALWAERQPMHHRLGSYNRFR
jgi:hypothetical protein